MKTLGLDDCVALDGQMVKRVGSRFFLLDEDLELIAEALSFYWECLSKRDPLRERVEKLQTALCARSGAFAEWMDDHKTPMEEKYDDLPF